LIHPNPEIKSKQQLDAIKRIKNLEGVPNIFVAGELSTIREIKRHLTNENSFKNAFLYTSSYWKIGVKEEEHKQAKKITSFCEIPLRLEYCLTEDST